jgi:predicted RNA-binding protein YlxR (DUF448 family)
LVPRGGKSGGGGFGLNAELAEIAPEERERGPSRRCLVTGRVAPKAELLRFVVGPAGALVPDVRAALPGRGLWVDARRETLALALKKGVFARAAKAPVQISPRLAEEVEALLLRQALGLLGLAYKAGAVRAGFAKVERLLAEGRALALLEAYDAGPHGAAKLRKRANAAGVPVLTLFSAEEIGLALGRENMVHAALGAERLARRFLEETRRFAGFRQEPRGAGAVIEAEASPIPSSRPTSESEENE